MCNLDPHCSGDSQFGWDKVTTAMRLVLWAAGIPGLDLMDLLHAMGVEAHKSTLGVQLTSKGPLVSRLITQY